MIPPWGQRSRPRNRNHPSLRTASRRPRRGPKRERVSNGNGSKGNGERAMGFSVAPAGPFPWLPCNEFGRRPRTRAFLFFRRGERMHRTNRVLTQAFAGLVLVLLL